MKLTIDVGTYHLPADLESRPDDAPAYLTLTTTNHSLFDVTITEVGLCFWKRRWLPVKKLHPLRCWQHKEDSALWPGIYNPLASEHDRGVTIESRRQHEFKIHYHENAGPKIATGVYAKTSDGKTKCSLFWWLPAWLQLIRRGKVLQRWRTKAKCRSEQSGEAIRQLLKNWKAKPNPPDLIWDIQPSISGREPGGSIPIVTFSMTNPGPNPISVSSCGLKATDMAKAYYGLTHSIYFGLPVTLVPSKPVEFWVKSDELASALRRDGYTGQVKIVAVCADTLGFEYKSNPLSFDVGNANDGSGET